MNTIYIILKQKNSINKNTELINVKKNTLNVKLH